MDVQGAVDYLKMRPEVNPKKIGLVGHSMGGATAILAMARIPEINVLIAESAYATLEDNIGNGIRYLTGLPPFPFAPAVIWFAERESGLELSDVRPIDVVTSISPRPILFVHGEFDGIIDVENTYRLYEAAYEPKSLYIVKGAGHGGFLQAHPDEFETIILNFLDSYLLNSK
jgi:fermentation-respiration switch protein FrsA (DUF1100 family)